MDYRSAPKARQLTAKERKAGLLHYGVVCEPQTMEQVAGALKLSVNEVNLLLDKMLDKLLSTPKEELEADWMLKGISLLMEVPSNELAKASAEYRSTFGAVQNANEPTQVPEPVVPRSIVPALVAPVISEPEERNEVTITPGVPVRVIKKRPRRNSDKCPPRAGTIPATYEDKAPPPYVYSSGNPVFNSLARLPDGKIANANPFLVQYQKEHDMHQKDVAAMCGISQPSYWLYRNGLNPLAPNKAWKRAPINIARGHKVSLKTIWPKEWEEYVAVHGEPKTNQGVTSHVVSVMPEVSPDVPTPKAEPPLTHIVITMPADVAWKIATSNNKLSISFPGVDMSPITGFTTLESTDSALSLRLGAVDTRNIKQGEETLVK